MIDAIVDDGEEITISEIQERVFAKFGENVPQKSLQNVLFRARRRGDYMSKKGPGQANLYSRAPP